MTEVCHGRIDVGTIFALHDFNEVTDALDQYTASCVDFSDCLLDTFQHGLSVSDESA
jgi:hypothetical protein